VREGRAAGLSTLREPQSRATWDTLIADPDSSVFSRHLQHLYAELLVCNIFLSGERLNNGLEQIVDVEAEALWKFVQPRDYCATTAPDSSI